MSRTPKFSIQIVKIIATVVTLLGPISAYGANVDQCSDLFSLSVDRPAGVENLVLTEYFPIGLGANHRYFARRVTGDRPWFVQDSRLSEFSKFDYQSEAEAAVEKVFEIYEDRGIVDHAAIDSMRTFDKTVPADTLSFAVYREHVTHEPRVVIRVIDVAKLRSANLRGKTRLPIEVSYPHLRLPERESGSSRVIEFGRLGRSPNVEGDLKILLSHLARSLSSEHSKFTRADEPVIYVEATAVGARLYERVYGFKIAYTPRELGKPGRFILKMPLGEFIRRYDETSGIFRG